MSSLLRTAVTDALNPALRLLTGTLLTTPTLAELPRVAQLWDTSWQIMLACYGLLITVAGILLMGYESVQTRYAARDLLPRLVVGFFAGALSLVLAGTGIEVANALSRGIAAPGLDPDTVTAGLTALVSAALTEPELVVLLLAAAAAVMLIGVLIGYIVRVGLVVLLIAGAPLVLMWHALPQTDGMARWWWRTYAGCLAIQLCQSLTLVVGLGVFLAPDGFAATMFGGSSAGGGVVNMLIVLALLYILWKIPFWVLGAARGSGGRSWIGSLIRGYLTYQAFGLLRGRATARSSTSGPGGAGGPGGPGGSGPSGPGGGPGPHHPSGPYTRTRATSGGQLMLPLPGLRRSRRGPRPGPGGNATASTAFSGAAPPTAGGSAPARGAPGAGQGGRTRPAPGRGGQQLGLPLAEGDWPEDRPVLGRDGQYRLPIATTRIRRPIPPAPAPTTGATGAGATRAGAPGIPRPVAPARRGRQLELPLDDPQRDLWAGNRPLRRRPDAEPPGLRGGQYPLPTPGLTRFPRPAPVPTTPPPAAEASRRTPPAPPPTPPPDRALSPQLRPAVDEWGSDPASAAQSRAPGGRRRPRRSDPS